MKSSRRIRRSVVDEATAAKKAKGAEGPEAMKEKVVCKGTDVRSTL